MLIQVKVLIQNLKYRAQKEKHSHEIAYIKAFK